MRPAPVSVTVAIADGPPGADSSDTALLAGMVLPALLRGACNPVATSSDRTAIDERAPIQAPALIVRHVNDGRDAVDAGADLVVTRDPTTVAYAASREGLTVVPLPWDRAYLLIVPAIGSTTPVRTDDSLLGSLRTDLAFESVHAAARPLKERSEGGDDLCLVSSSTVEAVDAVAPRPGAPHRIAYDRSDGVSRDLAQRLVALSMERSSLLPPVVPELTELGPVLRAGGLDRDALVRSVAEGSETAYVLALPLDQHPRCDGARVVPLIETRATVVVRNADLAPLIDALAALSGGTENRRSP